MSEQLTTPIHSKEWVKEYYKRITKEILYKDMITGVKETFQRYDLGLVKEIVKPDTTIKKTRIQM